jgi:sec-independent protein translocase protein TatA
MRKTRRANDYPITVIGPGVLAWLHPRAYIARSTYERPTAARLPGVGLMLGAMSPWHWLLIIGVAAVVFGGRGKLSSVMGDAAKGIRAFKDGLKSEDDHPPAPQANANPQVIAPRVESSSVERDREDVRS